jgi:hypothetical protein
LATSFFRCLARCLSFWPMTMPQAPSLGCAMKCDVRLSRLWPLAATVLSPCDAAARSHPTRGSHGTHNCCILRKPASASRACAAAPSSLWGPPQVFEKKPGRRGGWRLAWLLAAGWAMAMAAVCLLLSVTSHATMPPCHRAAAQPARTRSGFFPNRNP